MTPSRPILPLLLFLGVLYSCPASSQETDAVDAAPPETSSGQPAPATAPLEDEPAADTPEPQPDPEILRQAEIDRTRYEQVIDQLEENASQNVYSPDLTEAYLNLAGTLTTLGQNEEADVVYDKALQTARISNGLDSPQQIPILEQAMKNDEILEDWQAVDTRAHLIFHIARRNYPVGDARRIRALNQLGDWKLRAAGNNLIAEDRGDAMQVAELFAREVELLDEGDDYAGKPYDLASLYLGKAKAELNVTREILAIPRDAFRTTGSNATTTTQRCFTVRLPNGRFELVCQTVEVPNLDYYIDPQTQKNMNIGRQLRDTRDDIVNAYQVLQTAGDDLERRDALLADVQALTEYYNAFVTDNGL